MEGKVKEYKIRITKIDKHTREENKGLEIEVTDPKFFGNYRRNHSGNVGNTNYPEWKDSGCGYPCICQ